MHTAPAAPDEAGDAAELKRRIAQAEKEEYQARHWKRRVEILEGAYVPRTAFETELAGRATVLRSDAGHFCRSEPSAIIALVAGDHDRAGELAAYLLTRLEEWFARYAEDRPFIVPAPTITESSPQDDSLMSDGPSDDGSGIDLEETP